MGNGAVNFYADDLYGFGGTGQETIPEAADQKALVDNDKASQTVNSGNRAPGKHIYLSILFILIALVVVGARI